MVWVHSGSFSVNSSGRPVMLRYINSDTHTYMYTLTWLPILLVQFPPLCLMRLKDAASSLDYKITSSELLFFISIFIVKLCQFIMNAANFVGKFGGSNTSKSYVQNVRKKKVVAHGIQTHTFRREK